MKRNEVIEYLSRLSGKKFFLAAWRAVKKNLITQQDFIDICDKKLRRGNE